MRRPVQTPVERFNYSSLGIELLEEHLRNFIFVSPFFIFDVGNVIKSENL